MNINNFELEYNKMYGFWSLNEGWLNKKCHIETASEAKVLDVILFETVWYYLKEYELI